MYSPRPGATSSRWEDDVPHEIKKKRYHILSEELRKTSYKYNKEIVGKELKVFVRGQDRKEGYLSAYTEGRIVTRFLSNDLTLIGQFITLKITSATELSVEGERISEFPKLTENI
jgi:tRNA-2-methylthio-N6-dimethylallyladenosine synthase